MLSPYPFSFKVIPRLADLTKENEYFAAMVIIQEGKHYESHRVNSQLQTVYHEVMVKIIQRSGITVTWNQRC